MNHEYDEAYNHGVGHELAMSLAAALPRLPQLTRLACTCNSPAPLAALPALPNLRRLAWRPTKAAERAPLPGGAWLARLERLLAPRATLAASLTALDAASQLREVCVEDAACVGQRHDVTESVPQLCSVIHWAGRQPGLQRLLLGDVALPPAAWQAVAAAQRGRPGLCINSDAGAFSIDM